MFSVLGQHLTYFFSSFIIFINYILPGIVCVFISLMCQAVNTLAHFIRAVSSTETPELAQTNTIVIYSSGTPLNMYCLIPFSIPDIGNKQTHLFIAGYWDAAVVCHTHVDEGKNAGLVRIRSTKNIKLIKSFCFIWMTHKYLKKKGL